MSGPTQAQDDKPIRLTWIGGVAYVLSEPEPSHRCLVVGRYDNRIDERRVAVVPSVMTGRIERRATREEIEKWRMS